MPRYVEVAARRRAISSQLLAPSLGIPRYDGASVGLFRGEALLQIPADDVGLASGKMFGHVGKKPGGSRHTEPVDFFSGISWLGLLSLVWRHSSQRNLPYPKESRRFIGIQMIQIQ